MNCKFILFIILCVIFAACTDHQRELSESVSEDVIRKFMDSTINVYEPYALVKLPIEQGIKIWNPGLLEKGPQGRIFAANMTGEIYSLVDSDGDGLEDKTVEYCDVKDEGFRTPSGMAFKDWDLYVGLPQQIRVYRDLDQDFVADTSFAFFTQIPYSDHPYEYSSGLRFDKEGWLYFALSTDSWNAGASPDPHKFRGAILKVSPDGNEVKIMATGIRSVHGMDFNKNGELFFVDNQGGQNQVEELHMLREGSFYGHNTNKYGDRLETSPIATLQSEVAPAEIRFHPENDYEYLYITFYGPGEYWERGAVARLSIHLREDSLMVTEEVLADIPKCAGLTFSDNGDLYLARTGKTDYWYFATEFPDGAIYRLIKAPWVKPANRASNADKSQSIEGENLEKGAFIFASRACSSCHGIDGKTELLGPNLKNIGSIYDREELLEEIREPSKRMKPGTFSTKITTIDGEVFLGRVITQNEEEIQLMLVGNIIKKVPVVTIDSLEAVTESLMYEGLLAGLSDEEIDALLDYLISLEN